MNKKTYLIAILISSSIASSLLQASERNAESNTIGQESSTCLNDSISNSIAQKELAILVTFRNGKLSIIPEANYGTCFMKIEKKDSDTKYFELLNLSKERVEYDYDFQEGDYLLSIYSNQGYFATEISIK